MSTDISFFYRSFLKYFYFFGYLYYKGQATFAILILPSDPSAGSTDPIPDFPPPQKAIRSDLLEKND